jgi:hypothetical protein
MVRLNNAATTACGTPVDNPLPEIFFLMHSSYTRTLIAMALAASAGAAWADRPLTVDNAAINPKGGGDIELSFTRIDSENLTTVKGGYSLLDNVELNAFYASASGLRITGLAAKWVITPTPKSGCNVGAELGYTNVKLDGFGSSNGTGLNGILSCYSTVNFHANLGYSKPSGASGATSYGLALEYPMNVVTPHIEVFGVEDIDPTVQIGLRGNIAKNVQLDGTVGRSDGVSVYSVGLRVTF